ncbi:MAG: cysteine--tRNA ligase [Sulfolobales archaeon]|nr:cysteine--tRNA ligase [Sulfolobales archaeon]
MSEEIKVFNTYGRKLEPFEPLKPHTVTMYVCGPTVYDYVHIGHGRTFVAFDAVVRYLKLRGYNVIRVQNITDIDDKIINKARETGKDWREIVDYYTKDYMDGIRALKVKIDAHPKVTEHIKEIIEFVQGLIDKGHAYVAPSGSVYFDVDSFPNYGALSNTKKEQWNQGEEFVKEKKNPYDFALWKAWKPGEPYWESPWGKGRPGWHIECSTMSTRFLGERFDIHGGGIDLVFPHHENEIAQSEAYFGHKWVNYWLHVAYLTIRKEKMSKSLKNIIPLNEALKKWGPNVLRYWYLSAHYRSELDYSEEALESASKGLQRLKDAVALLRGVISQGPKFRSSDEAILTQRQIVNLIEQLHEAMSLDFNTAEALNVAHRLADLAFSKVVPSEDFTSAVLAMEGFRMFNEVFGVMDEEFGAGMETLSRVLDAVLEIRNQLRAKKMYDLSDQIRAILESSGVKVLDSKDKSTWRLT